LQDDMSLEHNINLWTNIRQQQNVKVKKCSMTIANIRERRSAHSLYLIVASLR